MAAKYFIRGTIAIHVDGSNAKILVTPCAGFLTPDKPKKALAFPVPVPVPVLAPAPAPAPTPANAMGNVLLFALIDEQKFECPISPKMRSLHTWLLTLAAQQRPVELHFEIALPPATPEITGFVFPIPSP